MVLKLRIMHLLFHTCFFVDDNIIFVRASDQETEVVQIILAAYESASGQMINLKKSMLSVSRNVPQNRLYELKQLLSVKAVENTDKYLGLPTINLLRIGCGKNLRVGKRGLFREQEEMF